MIQLQPENKHYNYKLTVYACQPDEALLFRRYARPYGLELSLYEQPVSAENANLAAGSRCISICHTVPVTAFILDKLRDVGVRHISTRSIGCDHIDIHYANKIGISVSNVRYSPDGVADYTLMLILMATRRVTSVLQHDIPYSGHRCRPGHDLSGLTVGVAGTGRIGQAVIHRLRGFGCRILAYDICQDSTLMPYSNYVDRDTLLSQSDILTLHMPATDATYHWIDRCSLAAMKRGSLLINTARGALVDSYALIETLERGELGGAALDVLEGETDIQNCEPKERVFRSGALIRLREMPNVILTPHTAFYTEHAVEEMVENSIKNCWRYENQILSVQSLCQCEEQERFSCFDRQRHNRYEGGL